MCCQRKYSSVLPSNLWKRFEYYAAGGKKKYKMKKILSNGSSALIAQVVAIIYGFVLPRLILEKYGSELNGLAQSIKQFLGIISFLDMGVGQVVRSSLYSPLSRKDYQQISRIMVSGRRYYRSIAYILLGYVALLIVLYPILVNGSFDWIYTASLIGVMAISSFAQYYFGIINEQLLHADQKSYLIYGMQIFTNLSNLILCVWMIRMDASMHAVKLMTSLVFVIKPLVYGAYIQRRYQIDKAITYESEPIQQKWSGVTQHVSAVVLDGTDNIVLTFFSTLSNVSIYSVYYMIIGSIQGFYQSAAVGIQSAAGAMWAKQDQQGIRKMFSTVELALHTVTVFLFCCTGILIVPFVQVYTNGLTDANYMQPVFAALLVLAYGIRCLRTPYNIWILAAGHFKQTQRCHITAAAMNLLISIFAVSRWGLVGIAIGTLIAMCYQTVWMMIYATNKLIKCSTLHVLKQWIVDIAAVLLIYAATSGIVLQEVSYLGWFFMAVKVAVIAVVCSAAALCLFYPKQIGQLIKNCSAKTGNQK
jgi:O-antigen/teichoic acid export membrane protein